ncbi:hypothetical protein SAMN05216241_103251 [Limimonas halophila]|uniref:Motility protein B-like N-terminal domain-containing protein n=2 Tax=Limimonas halophila TaxID=1082479 RepID=A0A1G7Q6C7_9PROT|nr:hypothetical protein SAMN05216241_103251 [Limimonas halophila]
MLSLYLLLLAFFIMMTTMANYADGRREAVVKSVVTTFRGEVAALKSLKRPQSGSGMQDGGASLSDQIESLFKQSLPAVKVEQSARGTVLRLEAPANALFVQGRAAFAPGRGRLLNRLVDVLTSKKGVDRFYELRFLHSVERGQGAGPRNLQVLRSGLVARRLESLGLGSDTIGTGLMPGQAKRGRLAFEVHMHRKAVSPGELDVGAGAS